jgi:hypothetical protein
MEQLLILKLAAPYSPRRAFSPMVLPCFFPAGWPITKKEFYDETDCGENQLQPVLSFIEAIVAAERRPHILVACLQ